MSKKIIESRGMDITHICKGLKYDGGDFADKLEERVGRLIARARVLITPPGEDVTPVKDLAGGDADVFAAVNEWARVAMNVGEGEGDVLSHRAVISHANAALGAFARRHGRTL